MKRFLKFSTAIYLLVFVQLQAYGGAQDGPFVVWINLSANKSVDNLVREQLSKQETCLEPRLVVSPPPEWMSPDLIRKGMINGDKKTIASLNRLMLKPVKGFAHEGFDGIVVYDESKGPRFSSLSRGWTAVAREKVAMPASKESQWKAFCVSLPEITRPI